MNIPIKKIHELEHKIKQISELQNISMKYINVKTGEYIVVGGLWNTLTAKYVEIVEDSTNIFELSDDQWKPFLSAFEALFNLEKLLTGSEDPIIGVIVHGPRRSGKTVLEGAVCSLVMIAKPGARVRAISLRQFHGKQIMDMAIKNIKNRELYEYNKHDNYLRFVNGSRMTPHAEINVNADRGTSDDVDIFDEMGFLKEGTIFSSIPAMTDRGGFFFGVGSPNGRSAFMDLAKKSEDPDPLIAGLIHTHHLTPAGNTFIPFLERNQRYLKHVLSEEAYRQECLGEFLDDVGLVLPHFERATHVLNTELSGDFEDHTAVMCHKIWPNHGHNRQWLVGVDYNADPTAGVICKFDKEGRIWYVSEVVVRSGTEIWGETLYQRLIMLGADDPYKEAIIIGDASGRWQDPQAGRKSEGASYKILRSQGWIVKPPRAKGLRNPDVALRMEVSRSMCYNAAGEIRMYVDPSCTDLIRCFETLPLGKTGLPNKFHKLNHIYDAATYPLYRIWGTGAGKMVWGKKLVVILDRGKNLPNNEAA